MNLTKDEQLRIMRKQLENFDHIFEKIVYLNMAFDPDPHFTKEARDEIRAELHRDREFDSY